LGSLESPQITNISLPVPKGVPPAKWSPVRDPRTRVLPITASVCLDFAFPGQFSDIGSRPSLILAPARTWERSVGISMWLQAKQRAEELNSMVLWCDGGAGGVSGVAGGGIEEYMQVGEGSWVRTVGMQYPFNPARTAYARFGDFTFILAWALASGTLLVPHIAGLGGLARLLRRRGSQQSRIQNGRSRDGEQPPLIDF